MLKSLVLSAANVPLIHQFITAHPIGRQMASRFVAGETLDTAIPATAELNVRGIRVSLDHLGENTTNRDEAAHTASDYIAIIDRIVATGVQAHISIKLSALGLDISEDLCLQHIRSVLAHACQHNIFVRIDMEGSHYTEQTLRLTYMLHAEYTSKTTEIGGCVGTVIQSMLYRSADDVASLIAQGIRVRLVKGAYREPANIAFQQKWDVDEHYRQIMHSLLANGIYPAIATHDEQMITDACTFARKQHIAPNRFEFQMLYGIRRDLQENLVKAGYNVRVYLPYGTQWYPYLTRRMAERPANLIFIMNNLARG